MGLHKSLIKISKEGSNGALYATEKTVYLNITDINNQMVLYYYQRIIYRKFCEFSDGVCD